MMKSRIFSSLIIGLVFLSACQKDNGNHVTYQDDYRFYVKGKASGIPFEYYAGKEDYYMETSYSFKDSVVEMVGRLAPHGSANKNAFEIRLRGEQSLSSAQQFEIENNLETGHIPLRDATGFRRESDKFILNLHCDTSSTQYQTQWIFPDSPPAYGNSVVKEVSLEDYQKYPVRMIVNDGFCSSEVEHVINLEDDCDATFDINVISGTQIKLSLKNQVGTVDDVKWFYNDSAVTLDPNHYLTLANTAQSHVIRCEVNFSNGCQKIIERKLGPAFSPGCIADFHVQKKREEIYDPMQLATVEMTYYDENGKAYTSYYNDVNGEFKIESLTPYNTNEDGNPTMRFFFETDAVLKSSDGSTMQLSETFGSFAVAHP